MQLEFEDTAPGLNREQHLRLFERLYRAEPSRNRDTGGSGLGLALVKVIVESHQGQVTSYPSPLGGVGIRIALQEIPHSEIPHTLD